MSPSEFISQLNNNPESITFNDTMAAIASTYEYTPTRFTNGLGDNLFANEAGQNEGSCKIFAFAKEQKLNPEQTLHCFGDFYRQDVLGNPEGTDHSNIRTFIKHGWDGIVFDSSALQAKASA